MPYLVEYSTAPKAPARQAQNGERKMRPLRIAAACTLSLIPSVAFAQDGTAFDLGQITVQGEVPDDVPIAGSTLGQEAIEAFQRNTLDDAVNLIPGVSGSNSGGSRNERLIFVRGFDRFQVPLSIDGIRVYLPADNRLDYGRFLTPDIAEIQVAKGYASVLDGPGAMGGAINLVTRKPTKALEAEGRATLDLDRDAGYAGYTTFALLGTRQDQWYAQASFARTFRDHWDLAGGFVPTATEDGGARDKSRTADWRVNVKLGFTPNATDEYAISYTRQEGSKNAPLHVTSPQAQAWTWPYWNLESIYFLSTTALSDALTLKTRLYRNTFDNLLRGFDDHTQTTQTSSAGRVFNSWYDDQAYGGSLQLDYATGHNTLCLAFHYRRDEHIEWQQTFGASGIIELPQQNLEDTFSLAIEDRLALSPELMLTGGFSYDWRNLKAAEEYGVPPGGGAATIFSYPLVDADAWNAQGRLEYTPDETAELHLSLSSRQRFPTVFERFSSRFGGATSNPDLKAERATNLEIGGAKDFGAVRLEGALFYSWLEDAIVSFPFVFNNTNVSQSRNVGKGEYYGAELTVSGKVADTLDLGATWSFIHRDFTDPSIAAFEATGVPTHKGFLWAEWRPMAGLTVLPSLEFASDRWTVTPNGATYYRTGSYVQGSLRLDYEVIDGLVLGAGVKNAFDDNYVLTDGFPEPGRSFFLTARFKT
jgi:iron complex outermembrane receptor protein